MWHLLLMRNLNRSLSAARQSAGFTLVELLVVIGIIAILAGVALGPITGGIRKAQESGAMQTTRTIDLAEFQYANDNNGSYPDGANVGVIGQALLTGNYVSDPSLFWLSADKASALKKATATTGFTTVNCSFDFMSAGGGGVGATAPDTLPMVWNTGETATEVAASANLQITPANGVFGKDGLAVCYHSNNAFFKAPNNSTTTTADGAATGQITFISKAYSAPTGANAPTYTGLPGT
jgi:prepilin-type N-terminal cleavage/methylation domain-containing protein